MGSQFVTSPNWELHPPFGGRLKVLGAPSSNCAIAEAQLIDIEPLDLRHENAMQRLLSDPLVTRYTPKPEPYPPGEAAREIQQAIADRETGVAYCFAILVDDNFGGVCKLKGVTGTRGELGYWVGKPFWGKGIATKAARPVIEYAFDDLDLKLVVAHTMSPNEVSSRVLEKLGFEFRGTEPNTHPKWPETEIVRKYRLLRQDWQSATDRK